MGKPVDRPRHARWLASALLLGVGALAVGAALHPVLPADGPSQLHLIARTPRWQAVHVVMLVGTALLVAGVCGQVAAYDHTMRRPLLAVFAVIGLGLVLNASNVAFMAVAGTGDAGQYLLGHLEAAASFAREHARSLQRARLGNALIALGSAALAVIEWRTGASPYRWVLASAAAIGGLIGVTAFDPGSRAAVAAAALFSLWAAAAAIDEFRGKRE